MPTDATGPADATGQADATDPADATRPADATDPTNATGPAYASDNVFAKILRGELPAERVYEDAATIVIMDIMPRGTGHVLVIPKGASRNILDISNDALFALARTTRAMAIGVKAAFGADGVSVEHYVEAASGQTVFHTHVHVIPRFDGVALRPHSAAMAPKEEIAANAAQLRATLAAR